MEEVLRGAEGRLCRACGGTGSNFKGGRSVGHSADPAPMYRGNCLKCKGLGKVVSQQYAEARQILGLPPVGLK